MAGIPLHARAVVLRRAWVAVALVPVFFVAALALGHALPGPHVLPGPVP